MLPPLSDTIVDARELIGRPGTSRSLERLLDVPTEQDDVLVRFGPHITVRGIIESVVDGLLVRATVEAPVRLACSRCLTEFGATLRADAVELFSRPRDGDAEVEPGYELGEQTFDIGALVRDAVAEVAPLTPRCREDCAGLCPVCGADRNTAPCGGHPTAPDPRWGDLAGLRLPDPDSP